MKEMIGKALRLYARTRYPELVNAVEKSCTYTQNSTELQQDQENPSIANAAQNHKKLEANRTKAQGLSHRINYWLLDTQSYNSLERVTGEHLKQAITAVENITHRNTIDDRIRLLITNQCIKENPPSVDKILTYNLEPEQKQQQETEREFQSLMPEYPSPSPPPEQ